MKKINRLSIFQGDWTTNTLRKDVEFDYGIFPGGEVFFRLIDVMPGKQTRVVMQIADSDGLMLLLMATDALKRAGVNDIDLYLPYVPYGRQDRVCNPGESHSLKVLCGLINMQHYKNVYTFDTHSFITDALLDNLQDTQSAYLDFVHDAVDRNVNGRFLLVSPDGGSLKKAHAITKRLSQSAHIRMSGLVIGAKERDLSTGEILGTSVNLTGELDGMECVIFDDICDGGRTFVELAKVLKDRGAGRIGLVVSHGIFSKGLAVFDGLIDWVCATDSWAHYEVYSQSPVQNYVQASVYRIPWEQIGR